MPRSVGSRELKAHLSSYLREVRAGATLVVTDRGRPIAELRPLDVSEDPVLSRLKELSALGVVSRASGVREAASLAPFEPIASRGASMAQAIDEGREDRF